MYQPVPPYTDPVPPSTNQYRTWRAPGQLRTGNVAWGLQTSAQFTLGLVLAFEMILNMAKAMLAFSSLREPKIIQFFLGLSKKKLFHTKAKSKIATTCMHQLTS